MNVLSFLNVTPLPSVYAEPDEWTLSFTAEASGGYLRNSTAGGFPQAWEALTGQIYNPEAPDYYEYAGQSFDYIYRAPLIFDTSAIPDGATVTNVTLDLFHKHGSGSLTLVVQRNDSTYPHNPIETGDYWKDHYSGDYGNWSTSGLSDEDNFNVTLNTAVVSKTSLTRLMIRGAKDIANLTDAANYHGFYSGHANNETLRPRLHVDLSGTKFEFNMRILDDDGEIVTSNCTAYAYDSSWQTDTPNATGYAEFGMGSESIQYKVLYQDVWVNGTESLSISGTTTIDVNCNIYDITLNATYENGIIAQWLDVAINVTGYSDSATNSSGICLLENLANTTYEITVQREVWNVTTLTLTADTQVNVTMTYTATVGNDYQGIGHGWQRQTFYANGRYWLMYGGVYCSTLDGKNWTSPTSFETGIGDNHEFSCYFDGTYIHWVHGEYELNTNMTYQRGTPLANGTITWATKQEVLAAGGSAFAYRNPSITVDSNGYPWIGYTYFNNSAPLGHKDTPYAITSSTNDGTWTTKSGFPYLTTTASDNQVYVDMLAMQSGEVMALTMTIQPSWIGRSKIWNGADWEAEKSIPDFNLNDGDQHSAVSNGTDVFLVVCSSGDDLLYWRWNGTEWGDKEELYANIVANDCPTLSIDLATGRLYTIFSNTSHTMVSMWNGSWNKLNYTWLSEIPNTPRYVSSFDRSMNGDIGYTYTITGNDIHYTRFGAQNRLCVNVVDPSDNPITSNCTITMNNGTEYQTEISNGWGNFTGITAFGDITLNVTYYGNTLHNESITDMVRTWILKYQVGYSNETEFGSSTTQYATAHSYGRKTFWYNGYQWGFYSDGDSIWYATTTDGTTWSWARRVREDGRGDNFYVHHEPDTAYVHYIYCNEETGEPVIYRRGTLGAGVITWLDERQITNNVSASFYPCGVSTDINGYPFVVYAERFDTSSSTPYVCKSSTNDGSWVDDTDFPFVLTTNTSALWSVQIIRLSGDDMYVVYSPNGHNTIKGRLWNGAVMGGESTITTENVYDNYKFGVVSDSVGYVHLIYRRENNSLFYRKRTTSWQTEVNLGVIPATFTITSKETTVFVVYLSTAYKIDMIQNMGSGWTTAFTLKTVTGDYIRSDSLTISERVTHLCAMWTRGTSSPYTVEGMFFMQNYTFYGLYDEALGTLTGSVNVTAYYDTGKSPESFLVNVSYAYLTDTTPMYFHYELGVADREYWISTRDTTALSLYIFNDTLTVYTVQFIDLAGALDTYPYVEAQHYVNGTLTTVEKRKVDEQKKLLFSLNEGSKYTIIVQNGVSYTFGDLLVTSDTTIELTLKGVEFPQNIIIAYKYVRIYSTRHNNQTSISIVYTDTRSESADVTINILYNNGTSIGGAYPYTYSDTSSFNHTWTSANYSLTYRIQCVITHERYGVMNYNTMHLRSWSTQPWGIPIGTIPGINTADLIPMCLIFGIVLVFSKLNAYVAAFAGWGLAAVITWLGWINIPATYLTTALIFAVLMAYAYKKKRSVYG